MRATSRAGQRARRGPGLRDLLPSGAVAYILIATLVIVGIVIWDQTRPPEPPLDVLGRPIRPPVTDPAERARNGVSGLHLGVRVVDSRFDQETGTVTIGWVSKYYDSSASKPDNRQYLATEGRLAVQLILHDTPQVNRVQATMFRRDLLRLTPLATVTGARDQRFEDYAVSYAGPLQ